MGKGRVGIVRMSAAWGSEETRRFNEAQLRGPVEMVGFTGEYDFGLLCDGLGSGKVAGRGAILLGACVWPA